MSEDCTNVSCERRPRRLNNTLSCSLFVRIDTPVDLTEKEWLFIKRYVDEVLKPETNQRILAIDRDSEIELDLELMDGASGKPAEDKRRGE